MTPPRDDFSDLRGSISGIKSEIALLDQKYESWRQADNEFVNYQVGVNQDFRCVFNLHRELIKQLNERIVSLDRRLTYLIEQLAIKRKTEG